MSVKLARICRSNGTQYVCSNGERYCKKGVPVAKAAGDGNHTGINRVHQEENTSIKKESDKNHVRKNITKKLFKLHSQDSIT